MSLAETFSAEEIASAEADVAAEAKPEPVSPPEPVAEAAPEATEKPAETSAEEPKVPVAVLQAERKQRQEFERKVAELQGRIEAMREFAKPTEKPAETPEINIEEDPFGALKAMKAELDSLRQGAQETSRLGELQSAYRAAANEFHGKTPDFMDAYNHLLQSRANELRVLYQMPEEQIGRQLQQEEMGLVALAFKQNRNPAELLYENAKLRGYAKKAAAPAVAPAAASPPTAPPVLPAAAIEAEKAKAAAATSLSSGGKSPKAGPTAEDLLEAQGEEFDKLWDKIMVPKKKSRFR